MTGKHAVLPGKKGHPATQHNTRHTAQQLTEPLAYQDVKARKNKSETLSLKMLAAGQLPHRALCVTMFGAVSRTAGRILVRPVNVHMLLELQWGHKPIKLLEGENITKSKMSIRRTRPL